MASGLSDASEYNALLLIFQNTNWANVGDATGLRGSSTAGSLYVGLSTGTLSDTSTQTTTQAAYGSYARVAVARSSGGWTVTQVTGSGASTASNAAAVTFPAASSGTETETDFTVGLASGTGAGEAMFWGALTSPLAVSTGITPSFAIGALVCSLG
jgi:hypothetical protein